MLLKLAEKNPKFRDIYLAKSQHMAQRFEAVMDVEQVMQELDDLENVLDEMETLIMSSLSSQESKFVACWFLID